MNPIKKVKDKKIDNFVRRFFVRYGLGEFEKKPIKIQVSANGVKIAAGFEYVNPFHLFLSKLVSGKLACHGNIISLRKRDEELKNFGIEVEIEKVRGRNTFKHIIDQEIDASDYKKLVVEFYNSFIMLNIDADQGRLLRLKSLVPPKITTQVPGFVTLILPIDDLNLVKSEFLFDIPEQELTNFKRAEINHKYIIEDIEIPHQFQSEPEMARLMAKRKGKILRKVKIDGKAFDSEIDLEA